VSASAPTFLPHPSLPVQARHVTPKMGDHWPERKGRAGWMFA
jgi:hypothetical protein